MKMMKDFKGAIAVLMATSIILPVTSAREVRNSCAENSQCKPDGEYCLNGTCENCFDCAESLNRHSPSAIDGQHCAVTPNECGDCLAGHENQNPTDDNEGNKCFLISTFNWNNFLQWTCIIALIVYNFRKKIINIIRFVCHCVRNRRIILQHARTVLSRLWMRKQNVSTEESAENNVNPDTNISNGALESSIQSQHSSNGLPKQSEVVKE